MLNLEKYSLNNDNFLSFEDKFLLNVNGVDLSDYVVELSYDEYDISTADSGLDDTGTMQMEVVAKDKKKLTIKWSDCPSSYKKKIKQALSEVQFNGSWVTGDDAESVSVPSYRGDRKYVMKRNRQNKILWEISVSVIGLGGE